MSGSRVLETKGAEPADWWRRSSTYRHLLQTSPGNHHYKVSYRVAVTCLSQKLWSTQHLRIPSQGRGDARRVPHKCLPH